MARNPQVIRSSVRIYLLEGGVVLLAALLVEAPWLLIGSRTSLSAEEAAWASAASFGGKPLVDGIYILALGLWTNSLGLSELALRSYSAICTLIMLVGVWLTARRLLGLLAALLAPLLLAASPLVAAAAAEVSPYADGAGFAAFATAVYLLASGTRTWVLYGILAMATLATLPAALSVFAGHALHAAWTAQADRRRFLSTLVALGVACVPLGVAAALQALGVPGPGTMLPLMAEPIPAVWAGPAPLLLAMGLAGLVAPPRAAWFPRALIVATPWVVLVPLVQLGQADARLLVLAVPFGAIALAGALDLVGRALAAAVREVAGSETSSGALRVLAGVVGVVVLIATGWGIFARQQADRSDYRGLVFQVLREGRSSDLIVLAAPGLREAVEYYNHGRVPLLELPFGPTLLERTAEAMLASVITIPRQLWVLVPGADDDRKRVKLWLAGLSYPTQTFPYGAAELALYTTEPDMRSGQGRTVFGNIVELPEAALPAGAVPRDFPITVRLNWRAREPVVVRLVTFVELLDGSRVVARHEGEPVGGTRPTTGWEPGETIVDRIALPVPDNATTGSYNVRLSLSDLSTRARWRLADGRETIDLGMVRIGPATRPSL